jgi:PKD repeat protein
MTIDKTSFDCGKIGNHTVTLIVTDIQGNVASKTATVTIVGELTSSSISSIPTSSTFTGGVSTNLYLGYGAQSTTLQVSNMVVGGNGTNPRFYTYSWTGSASSQLSSTTSASPVFTPTAGGYYTFNVLVTNKYGCTTSATISICVKDIREVDKKGKFTGKVFICHAPPGNPSNNNTLSISVNAVASHLSQHSEDRLGSCSDAPCAAPSNMMMSTNSTDGAATKEVKIELSLQNTELVAYPNPFSQNTTVSFKLPYTEEVAVLEMYDMRGVKIQSLFNGPANANQTYEVKFNGQEISAGSYTFRLITSKEVKIFKVVMNTN